jgi:hypothetical protein
LYPTEPVDRFVVGGVSLRYESSGGASWDLIAEQILCLGEATTESGLLDEWRLCFVTDQHGAWLEGSMSALGRNDALHWLSVRLGCSLEVKLANTRAFRSRVMWPPELRERPLFQYQVPYWRRLFSRGLRRLGFAPLGSVQTVQAELLVALRKPRRHLYTVQP